MLNKFIWRLIDSRGFSSYPRAVLSPARILSSLRPSSTSYHASLDLFTYIHLSTTISAFHLTSYTISTDCSITTSQCNDAFAHSGVLAKCIVQQ
uniref:Uncharacterized protein n=1 Tax=Parascaris univalens TaxID=6257 RepID=A0A915CB00_PARUN